MDAKTRIDEIHSFLGFVVGEWPSVQPAISSSLARRCSRCILSERYSELEDGVCGECRAPRADRVDGGRGGSAETELAALLREYSGKGAGDYDAAVLFSGGKDSAYLLDRLSREFPELRLVALTVDNGFMSTVALANCRHILTRIERVDHITIRPKSTLYSRAFRHALTHLDGQGCYVKVDRMDGDLTFDIGRTFAASNEIPLLVSGLSPEQVERILGLDRFESPAETESRRRTESAGFPLDQLYDADELDRYWWNPDRWPASRRPRVLHPFHAWHYDEQQIPREVIERGLIEAGQDNPLITNNDTIPVMLAVDSVNLGYSSFEPEFAKLVREGQADRGMWLAMFQSIEYLAREGRFLPQCVGDTLSRLSLKPADLGLPELQIAAKSDTVA